MNRNYQYLIILDWIKLGRFSEKRTEKMKEMYEAKKIKQQEEVRAFIAAHSHWVSNRPVIGNEGEEMMINIVLDSYVDLIISGSFHYYIRSTPL